MRAALYLKVLWMQNSIFLEKAFLELQGFVRKQLCSSCRFREKDPSGVDNQESIDLIKGSH